MTRTETTKQRYGDDFFRRIGRLGGQIGGKKGLESGVIKGFAVTRKPKFSWLVDRKEYKDEPTSEKTDQKARKK
jgi:hypothetical protein